MHDPDKPVVLDERRGPVGRKATEIRRLLAEVADDQRKLRERQEELERFIMAAPALTWPDAAEKARYLIGLFAATPAARDPRRRQLIDNVLDDFKRLSAEAEKE